ncbi:MAG TPA: hypothetical protein VGS17_01010 [Candidatus Limnocylindria bacterium]|nr:hypothetical protein [Candidatus Limnocylindria bacterium]
MSDEPLSDARRCSACDATKAVDAFAFSNMATGLRQSYCRVCHAAYRHAHYIRNKADYVRRAELQTIARRLENRRLVRQYLLSHPCVDCGEADPVVLDLDHRDPATKVQAVTWLAGRRNWAIVAAEIDKCDVRCANCHRIRTAQQFGWSKLRRLA